MKAAEPLSIQDKRKREQERLYQLFKRSKKRELAELYDRPGGDALRKFATTLKRFGPGDADRFVAYVRAWRAENEPDLEIRHAALGQVGYRIWRIRAKAGLDPFDDPLPMLGEPDDVFQLCKRALA